MNLINLKHLLLFILLFFCAYWSMAQDELLNTEISIAFEDVSIKNALQNLETTTGVNIAYNSRKVKDDKITLVFEKELLSEVLDALLANKKLAYKVIGNTITIFSKPETLPVPSTIAKKTEKQKLKTATKYTLSGYFMDAQSKETLIGASVFQPKLSRGTSSNEYGFYSLTLPEGTYELIFSYIGYAPIVKEITLDQNIEFSPLLTLGNTLAEVVVTEDRAIERHASTKMSSNKISLDKVKSMPVLMGERDVLKIIQLMPGVQSGSEGSTGLYVRGGGPDQNLMLLDGVPIYNTNHLFGFLSTFNGDAIKSAEIIKGGFPARYGGRLSSIVDIRMKEGDMESFHGDVTLGLISGKINLEGPITKNKTSFSFSARRTWLDALTFPIQKSVQSGNATKEFFNYHFYDVNAKINHKFSNKSRLFLSTYLGNDKLKFELEEFGFDEKEIIDWGNRTAAARWNYQFSPKLFSNTTLLYSQYKFSYHGYNALIEEDTKKVITERLNTSDSSIKDFGAKIDFNFLPNPNHHIRFGAGYTYHQFLPTVNFQQIKLNASSPEKDTQGETKTTADEMTFYVEDEVQIGDFIQINGGLHLSNFQVETSSYTYLQPRLALSFLINNNNSVKVSFAKMNQSIHLLTSPGLGLPTDLWVPSTDKIEPESSLQYAIGYTRSLNKNLELTVEGFYKTMDNLLEYKSGFNVFSNSANWEDKVLIGAGKSYGVEVFVEKKVGKTTGWIGYTWSKSTRSFEEIDAGKSFPYKYDRRHDVGIAVTHKPSERVDFGLVWVYGTGNTYTLGTRNYSAINAGTETGLASNYLSRFQAVNHIESRNNQRAPAYHRLDLSVNFHKSKKRGKRTWSFGVYNAYSRQNPFIVYLDEKPNEGLKLKQRSLLPIIPFAAYSFKF